MKKILSIAIFSCIILSAYAQSLGNRINTNVNNRLNQKIDENINQILDNIENPKNNESSNQNKNNLEKNKKQNSSDKNSVNNTSEFIAGNKIIFFDNFSKDSIGDFPAHWNTNGSGEVVTIEGIEGRWFSIKHNSIVNPEIGKSLPENHTIEFDLFLMDEGSYATPKIDFGLTPVKNILKEDLYYREKFYVSIGRYNEPDGQYVEYGLKELIGNKNSFPLTDYSGKILHVSMSIQGSRISVYLDGNKIIDLPRALTTDMKNNFFLNNVYTIPASELSVLISNFKISSFE